MGAPFRFEDIRPGTISIDLGGIPLPPPLPSLEMIQAALEAGAPLATYCCDYCEES